MSSIVSRSPSSRNHLKEAFWMSIRFGSSRTCFRREKVLRARGAAIVLLKCGASLLTACGCADLRPEPNRIAKTTVAAQELPGRQSSDRNQCSARGKADGGPGRGRALETACRLNLWSRRWRRSRGRRSSLDVLRRQVRRSAVPEVCLASLRRELDDVAESERVERLGRSRIRRLPANLRVRVDVDGDRLSGRDERPPVPVRLQHGQLQRGLARSRVVRERALEDDLDAGLAI